MPKTQGTRKTTSLFRQPPIGLRRQWRKWRSNLSVFSATALGFSKYLKRRKASLSLAAAATIVHTTATLLEPWPIKMILDNVFLGNPAPQWIAAIPLVGDSEQGLLFLLVGLVLAVGLLRGFTYYYQRVLTASVAQNIAARIRLDLFNHVQRLSKDYHDYKKTGDLISRITNDVRMLREILVAVPLTLLGDLFLVVAMTAVMFTLDWRLTFVALAIYPLVGFVMRRYRQPMKTAVSQQRQREGLIATIAAEVFSGVETVQSYGLEEDNASRFGGQNKRGLRQGLRAARLEARFNLVSGLVVAFGTALVVLFASQRVLSGALTPGDLVIFVAYLRTFYRPLRSVSRLLERGARGVSSAERIKAVLDKRVAIREPADALLVTSFKGDIRFENVSLRRGRSRDALVDVNLHIYTGERIAVVGKTGAGKSSLISLLSRFYDPTKGRVLIDGHDVKEYSLSSLRGQIAYVHQEPFLFSGTVAENISLGKLGASREAIEAAVANAGVDEIILELPDGYETDVGERGGRLSGGQRQSVAIARAMLKEPSILILDEPLNGLDNWSIARVAKAIEQLARGRTVLLVTHQLESIENAVDRVVVMDHGSMVETGVPSYLRKAGGYYADLRKALPGKVPL